LGKSGVASERFHLLADRPGALRSRRETAMFPIIARSGEKLAKDEQRDCLAMAKQVAVIKMLFAPNLENSTCRRAEPVAIWKARKYIEEHSREELSLTKVARVVNMNANYLSENFKQVTGINFVEYVAGTRFAAACDLLRNANLRITEIAFAAGFQSLSQFNRVFKRFSGKSPTQYRAAALCRAGIGKIVTDL
jgi:AraC-like DNA-binding protein